VNAGEHLAQQAAEVGCAALVEAIGRLYGHRAHLLPLASPTPDRPVAGHAVTMLFLPWREDRTTRSFADVLAEGLGSPDPEPEVLVMSSGGYPDVSHGGGIKLARARASGGVVIPRNRLEYVLDVARSVNNEGAASLAIIRGDGAAPVPCADTGTA
jgi:hypothetical protein